MTPEQVKEYYRSGYNLHKETGISASSLSNWVRVEYIPFLTQKKLEKLTEGKLTACWSDLEHTMKVRK